MNILIVGGRGSKNLNVDIISECSQQVKKDYLNEGAMADSADLVVLGGWYGTGNKGGLISIFLMGCHDQFADRWRTVTKVHGGIDDKRLEELQDELLPNMTKISRDAIQKTFRI